MPNASLIVCERHGHWAQALRRALAENLHRSSEVSAVYETRSLPDCLAALSERPGSFVALAATRANVERVATVVRQIDRLCAASRVVVLADRSLLQWEDALRSAGALDVIWSRRQLDAVVKLATRQLEQLPTSSDADRINQLPWSPA